MYVLNTAMQLHYHVNHTGKAQLSDRDTVQCDAYHITFPLSDVD